MNDTQPEPGEEPAPNEGKIANTVDRALDDFKHRADKLDAEIHKAEHKHPPPLDHADDGGVV